MYTNEFRRKCSHCTWTFVIETQYEFLRAFVGSLRFRLRFGLCSPLGKKTKCKYNSYLGTSLRVITVCGEENVNVDGYFWHRLKAFKVTLVMSNFA